MRYAILFHMLDTFYLSIFYPSISLRNYASSYRKMERGQMNNARDKHDYIHKRGKIGPSHLLSKHGDLIVFIIIIIIIIIKNITQNITFSHGLYMLLMLLSTNDR